MQETGEEFTVTLHSPQSARNSTNGGMGASQIQVTDGPEVPPDRVATARDLQILAVKLRQGSDVGSTGRYDDNRSRTLWIGDPGQ